MNLVAAENLTFRDPRSLVHPPSLTNPGWRGHASGRVRGKRTQFGATRMSMITEAHLRPIWGAMVNHIFVAPPALEQEPLPPAGDG